MAPRAPPHGQCKFRRTCRRNFWMIFRFTLAAAGDEAPLRGRFAFGPAVHKRTRGPGKGPGGEDPPLALLFLALLEDAALVVATL